MRQQGARGWKEAAASLVTTVQQSYLKLPLFTRAGFTFITLVYVVQLLTLSRAGTFSLCLRASSVVRLQVWRLLTSSFFHVDVLHLVLNMLAFVGLGQPLEQSLGTLQLAHLTAVVLGVQGLIYVAIAYALALSHIYPAAVHTCALGFSGVIFGLIAVDNAATASPHRSLFGLVSIPTPLYPWLLLLLWQLLMPSASFLGHLAGLLAGLLWAGNGLRPLAPLSHATSVRWEASAALRPWATHASFIPTPASLPITSHLDNTAAHGRGAAPGGPLPASWAVDSQGAFSNMFGFGRVPPPPVASNSGSTPGSASSGAAAAERGQQHQQQPVGQQGIGGRLGGESTLGGGSSVSTETASARAAAAAAAEARQLKAAAGSAGSSSASA